MFEDHLIYADDVPRMRPFMDKIQTLRDMQRDYQRHTVAAATSRRRDNISPGICHEVAREYIIDPGDLIQATDSHTCMGGVNNALAWGVGATEYANLVHSGFTTVEVSESIRFELTGDAAAERHRERRDAAHPAALREAAADARPDHGVHRPGRAHAVARRAGHAREHGHGMLGAHGHRRGGREDVRVDRVDAARRRHRRRCARAPSRPIPTPNTPAACT